MPILMNFRQKSKFMPFNVLDFFSGCGGLSYGLERAGFNIVAGIDDNLPALNTFKHNHRKSIPIKLDLGKAGALDTIRERIGENTKIDLIVGGPPCQGFSLTGPRNLDDKRNSLYMSMLEAVKIFNPRAFLLENVKGMKTLYKGQVLEEIKEKFQAEGYLVDASLLDAANFGVPQHRHRLFIMGVKSKTKHFKWWPDQTHGDENWVTCGDAISDLPSLKNSIGSEESKYEHETKTEYQKKMRNDSNVLYNHLGTRHKQFVIDVINQVPEGGNWKNLPPGVGESRKFNEAWTRYHRNYPSRTIDTGHRNHFHYKWNRVPTIRENARLQSFPDTFEFLGTKTQQNKQVGNAVPPLLAKAIGEKLMEYFVGDKPMNEVLKQIYIESNKNMDNPRLSEAIGTMLEQQTEIRAELKKRIKTPGAVAIGIFASLAGTAIEAIVPGASVLQGLSQTLRG